MSRTAVLLMATTITAPQSVTGVTATGGDGQASVAFTPPTWDGGDPITSYTATALIAGVPTAITATGSGSPIVVTGLTNGTEYTFTVTATNGVGTGSASAASNSVTPAPTGWTLTSEVLTIGTVTYVGWSTGSMGAINPATYLGNQIIALATVEDTGAPLLLNTQFALTDVVQQNAFTSITANGITVNSIDAVYATDLGYPIWTWDGVRMFDADGTYAVTIA